MTSITKFINDEYKDYSQYVLSSRSIPSVIDGLKTSQRKIIYTALKSANTKKIKTASLSGNTISMSNYLHGPASLDGAIPNMTATWNNNIPLLDGEGNFGSRLINDAAAARYTYSGMSANFNIYFKDNDLLVEHYAMPDVDDPQPKYYLPIVPWVLINGIKGIAIGHAVEIQPRDIQAVSKLCIDYMAGKNIDSAECLPCYPNFSGTIFKNPLGKYICRGVYTQPSKTKIEISEIPVGIEREKYIILLDKLIDNNEIVTYTDKCSRNGFHFSVTVKRSLKLTSAKILRMFKLEKTLNENLTTIGADGRLKLFENVIDIIKYFCDWRVEQYVIRHASYIRRDAKELEFLTAKLTFINAVNANKIMFKNKTLPDIKTAMLKYNIVPRYHSRLLGLPVSAFSLGDVSTLEANITRLTGDIVKWRNMNKTTAYMQELKHLVTIKGE